MTFLRTRQMKDYVQTASNCGAVATLFAIYGPEKRVEDGDLAILQVTTWTATSIEQEINKRGKKFGIQGKFYTPGAKVTIPKTGNNEKTLLELLHQQFQEEVKKKTTGLPNQAVQLAKYQEILKEYMMQLIGYYKPRCLIVSGESTGGISGFHWQTFYISRGSLNIYNGRFGWIPEMTAGMGGGVVVVKGPAIL